MKSFSSQRKGLGVVVVVVLLSSAEGFKDTQQLLNEIISKLFFFFSLNFNRLISQPKLDPVCNERMVTICKTYNDQGERKITFQPSMLGR